ncbi:hypothetical protein MFIFM68171_08171 [Madurella fahalii]|uniref:Transcription factor domain-containing protein n=1 Tax=Madurella fahalii TaxID=1157608 RepID=A0ABQ0GJR5_9PEZI
MTLLEASFNSRVRETGSSLPAGVPPLAEESSQPIDISVSPGYKGAPDDVESILEHYRRILVPRFPFVPIPTSSSAHELSLKEPFLFKVITRIVTARKRMSHDSDQSAFYRWFRQCLADELLREQRKTLEMLQAILIFTAWGDYYLCGESRGSDLTQLAISLVSDMGLDRPPSPATEHTLQEQRAALGCFYISSVMRTVLRQPASLSFTKYMVQCCDRLAKARDERSDIYLVALVRVQLLASQWSAALPRESVVGWPVVRFDEGTYQAMRSVQTEAEHITYSLSNDIRSDALLWNVNYHAVLVRISEAAIHTPSGAASAHHRIQALCSCLQSCLNVIDSFLAIPVADLTTGCPLTTMCGLALALLNIRRLLLLQNDPDWDPTIARQTVDFPGLLTKLGGKFEEAHCVYYRPHPEGALTETDMVAVTDYNLGYNPDNNDVAAPDHETWQGTGRPAVLGYLKKVRQLKAWYLSDVSTQEGPVLGNSSFDTIDAGTLFGLELATGQAESWLADTAGNDGFLL